MGHERLVERAEPAEQVRVRPGGVADPAAHHGALGLADQHQRRHAQPDRRDHVPRGVRVVRDAEALGLLREAERRDRERRRAARVGLDEEVSPRVDQLAFAAQPSQRHGERGVRSESRHDRILDPVHARMLPLGRSGRSGGGRRAPRPAILPACGSRSTLVPPPMPNPPAWATTPGGCSSTSRPRCPPTSSWPGIRGPRAPTSRASPNLTETVSRIPAVLEPVWRRLEVPRLESQVRFDALLATNFLPPPTRSDGVVLVVHDLAFEVMPEAGPGFGERWRRRFDGWLRRSAAVIVPSSSAKADLLERHRLDESPRARDPARGGRVRGAGARRGRTRPRAVRDRRAVRAVRRRDRAAQEPGRAGRGVRCARPTRRRGS